MMRAEKRQHASPSELIAKSGRLIAAGTIIPLIAGVVGYLIDGNPGAVVAIAGAVIGFVCLIAGGLKLRNAGVALERYENDWAERPSL